MDIQYGQPSALNEAQQAGHLELTNIKFASPAVDELLGIVDTYEQKARAADISRMGPTTKCCATGTCPHPDTLNVRVATQ